MLLAFSGAAQAQDEAADPFRLFEQGDLPGAIAAAEDSLSRDPDNPHLWGVLAEAHARLARNMEAAEAFARAASLESDAPRRGYYLRARTLQLAYAGRFDEAQRVLVTAMADPALGTRSSLDWASVAIAAQDDAAAQDILSDETLYGGFTRQGALDAGYSAKRMGLDARAIRFFELGLALDTTEVEPLSPAQRDAIRREIRELRRTWSFILQASYTTAERPLGLSAIPLGEERAWQTGAELSRRLGGWRNGKPFSVFARAYHSRASSDEAPARDVTQGWLGVRYKPLATLNLNLEGSKLVALDDQGLDDWSARALVSAGQGIERPIGRSSWPYLHAYGDISYLFESDVAYALAEARGGYGFAIADEATTVTPYLVARASLDTGRLQGEALGAGAGISLRHWFDESETVAYRGFIDLDIQARERLAGDRRASGVLVSVTVGR